MKTPNVYSKSDRLELVDQLSKTTEKLFNADERTKSKDSKRTYVSIEKLLEGTARFVAKFASNLRLETFEYCPSVVLKFDQNNFSLEYLNSQIEFDDVNVSSYHNVYSKPRTFGLIAYDIEFVGKQIDYTSSLSSEVIAMLEKSDQPLLCHQFCFIDDEKRFSFLLYTDYRFTDKTFISLINSIITSLQGSKHCQNSILNSSRPFIKKWFIFAHYSLAEGSFIKSGKNKLIDREGKKWFGTVNLSKVEDVRADGSSRLIKIKDSTTNTKGPKLDNITITFCDTKDYIQKSLAIAASQCELKKYSLLDRSDFKTDTEYSIASNEAYKSIDRFATEKPERFERYSLRDAIVTASIPLVIHAKMGGDNITFTPRMAKYSEYKLAEMYKTNFTNDVEKWQHMLGQTFTYAKIPGRETNALTWVPNKEQDFVLSNVYFGGRNDCHISGPVEGDTYYHDCTSAYPMAVAAMVGDFNFSKFKKYTRSNGVEARVKELLDTGGPFLPHYLRIYVRYKESAIPMCPLKIDGAIVFPLDNDCSYMSWPEYWASKKNDLIEEEHIYSLVEYEALDTKHIPKTFLDFVKKRKEDPLVYKNISNFAYGKYAQGVSKDKPYSSVSCPAMAAYITSVTRAATGELANLNEYYAITTDGFISPVKKLTYGPINDLLNVCAESIERNWIKVEFHGTRSIFFKTRGYIIINDDKPKDAPRHERFKQAQMGLQAEDPRDFIKQVKDGVGKRRLSKTFSQINLTEDEATYFFIKNFNVNASFDWKFVVLGDTVEEKEFTVDDITICCTSFKTRPLKDKFEYLDCRLESGKMSAVKMDKGDGKTLASRDYTDLIATVSANTSKTTNVIWEFKKHLVAVVDQSDTKLTTKQYNGLKKLQFRNIHGVENIRDYRVLFNGYLQQILKDLSKRKEVADKVIASMNSYHKVISLQAVNS